MNTKQMEYILELSKMKNFNRAAENLYISQPALTYQIKTVEDEIGFRIFERSGRGVTLTPAGIQFVMVIENVLEELNEAIRQGKNNHQSFHKEVSISLPYRSVLYYLPEAVRKFHMLNPSIPVTPHFHLMLKEQAYTKLDWDITVSVREIARHMNNVQEVHLFDSRIYCIMPYDDILAKKERITAEDIRNRAMITINARFPGVMQHVARQVIQKYHNANYLAVDSHSMFHAVAAGTGVALVPGVLNEHTDEFAWVPFDTDETIGCELLLHSGESREEVLDFIGILMEVYREHKDDPI